MFQYSCPSLFLCAVSFALRGYGGSQHGAVGLRVEGLPGASLSGYEDADTLDHLGGGAGSFGEEDIGAGGAVEGVDRAGDDHRGKAGVELLGAPDEFVAVHLGHDEVTEQEVERTGERLLHNLERLLRGESRDNAVASCFEEKGTDREYLFIVVYAEDCLLGPQCSLNSAGRHLVVSSG
ncbi:MAG: Response regulator receiver protein [Edaphobacter sp.]|nr:Response regulator receiver protein [Edaphobacter sp.]MCU1319554.1 Response regulator receiver protein [Edaphobacter sp.]